MSDGTECPANANGQHNFQDYVTATLPPDAGTLQAVIGNQNYTSEAVARIVNSLTAKRNMIACSDCGKVIGGFMGAEAPVIDEPVETDPTASSSSSDSSDSE